MKNTPLILALGSNLGNRLNYLSRAETLLSEIFDKPVLKSAVYESPAWGKTDQSPFLNQVLVFNPNRNYSDKDVLKSILEIEDLMGRERFEKWGPRIIDIDLLYLGDQITENKFLKIPHPEIARRRFVLQPLADILPEFVDPSNGLTISAMLVVCPDESLLKKITD